MSIKEKKYHPSSVWEPPSFTSSFQPGIRPGREWICRPSLRVWTPPVYVFRAGYACWKGDLEWKGNNSGLFNVEYVSAGDARFIQDDISHVVERGSVYLVRKKGRHCFGPGPSGHLHKRYVSIAGPMLDLMLESMGLSARDVIQLAGYSWFPAFFKRVTATLATPGESPEKIGRLSTLAYKLLTELAICTVNADIPAPVREAMEFMNRNLTRPLTLGMIAAKSGVGIHHITRLFTSATRQTPMKYFADRRIAHARSLLEETTLSVKEIAALLGFKDQPYFSTIFSRYAHCSPREYRKRVRGDVADRS